MEARREEKLYEETMKEEEDLDERMLNKIGRKLAKTIRDTALGTQATLDKNIISSSRKNRSKGMSTSSHGSASKYHNKY
jgi:hypothetical protein